MRDEFKSSIKIKVLDTEKLFPALLVKLRNSVDDKEGEEWDRIKDALYRAKELTVQSSELGYVETPRGIFLLDYEACSMGCREEPITDEDSILAPVFFSYEKSSDVFPTMEINISKEEILSWPVKGEVNFANFIKTFHKPRIESNFRNWNRYLEGVMKEAS